MKNGQYDKENLFPCNYDMDNKVYLMSKEITNENSGIGIFKYVETEGEIRVVTGLNIKGKNIQMRNPIRNIFSYKINGTGILLITEKERWIDYNIEGNTISNLSTFFNQFGGSKLLLDRINKHKIEYPCPILIIYKRDNYSGNAFELCEDKKLKISKYYLYTGQKSLFNRVLKEEYDELRVKKVMIIGVGSIGSQICIQLTRSGIEKFVLVDYDKLSIENVVKHELTLKDLHKYKTIALKNKMTEINPQSSCVTIEKNIVDPSFIENFNEAVKDVDLIISSIDDVNAKYILDGLAIEHNKTVIFVNSFYNANAGIVLISNKHMACLDCLTDEIERMKDDLPDFNKEMNENYKCWQNNYIASANYNSNIVNYAVKVILEFLNGKIRRDKNGYIYNCYFVGNKDMKTVKGEDFFYDDLMVKKYIISGNKRCCVCGDE